MLFRGPSIYTRCKITSKRVCECSCVILLTPRLRASLERKNESPVRIFHRCDRQSIACAQQRHAREFVLRMRAQLIEADHALQPPHQLHIEGVPARIGIGARRIVMGIAPVEGAAIRIGAAHHAHEAGDSRLRAARMVEKCLVALLDLVANEVARLEVAHALPARGPACGGLQILDSERRRLGLEQPVFQKYCTPSSVTTASSGTSWRPRSICSTCWQPYARPTSSGRCQLCRRRRNANSRS